MTKITLYVKPNKEIFEIDEAYDAVVQMIEAPTRYLRCHTFGEKITIQKNFILTVEEAKEEF